MPLQLHDLTHLNAAPPQRGGQEDPITGCSLTHRRLKDELWTLDTGAQAGSGLAAALGHTQDSWVEDRAGLQGDQTGRTRDETRESSFGPPLPEGPCCLDLSEHLASFQQNPALPPSVRKGSYWPPRGPRPNESNQPSYFESTSVTPQNATADIS